MQGFTGIIFAALVAQSPLVSDNSQVNPPRLSRLWTETSIQDFRDGMVDPMMYVSHRTGLDPDSGCVEFFTRFDVDNNGYLDLACVDDSGPYLRLYFGSSGGFDTTRCRRYPVPGGGNVDLADLNLDGYAELIHSGWRSGHVTIYWGTDSGPSPSDTTWLGISGQSEAVAVYDLDRDSYLDILAGSDNGNLYIFWGSASGYTTANRSSVFLNGSVGHNIEVADLDKDGYGDIALLLWSRNRNPVIYWGAGRTPRTIAWLNVSSNNPHGITVADLDEDEWLDIVYTGYDTVSTAYIYYGSETGFSVSRRELINPGQCYGGSSAVLWNADKDLDLVFFRGNWGSSSTWRPRVFYNRRDTFPHFSNSRVADIGDLAFNASGGFVADLNYDGYQDIFVNNMLPDTQSYVLWGPYFIDNTPLPVDRDHHGVWREAGNIYTRSFNAIYASSVFDAGPDSVIMGGTCTWVVDEPNGSAAGIEVRGGSTPDPDSTWTLFYPVPTNGGSLPDSVLNNRYLQYQAVFTYARPCYLPSLSRISFDLNPALAVDVGVSQILAPAGTADSGSSIVPRAVVRNYYPGSPTATVNLRIGSGYSQTVSRVLGPYAIDTVSFPAWPASPVGTHAVRCSVYAATDRNHANDTLSNTVQVRVNSDVGPTAILAPPPVAESGSVHVPQVAVTNFGTRTEVFPVAMAIGSSYNQTRTDTLAPGQTDTVSFPSWTASPAGLLNIRTYTSLATDIDRHNDTLAQTTQVYTDRDAATIAIIAPVDTADSGTVITPQARIANFGTSAASIPARMRIGSDYNQTVSTTIQPGETLLVSFPAWTASPMGTHAVRCSTMLQGDTIANNDLKTDSVFVHAHRDARAVAILAPLGACDSGAVIMPVCRIANDGTSPGAIPVRLTIGTGYNQTRTKTLAAGATDTVHFADWLASPLGNITVRCSTALSGDEQLEDDTLSNWVYVGNRVDAAALAILAPIGGIDSGVVVTPVCSIMNLSTSPKTIPVTMQIGAGYSQARTKFLWPGASDTIGFPSWTAQPVGTLPVLGYTSLAGDTFPDNDTVATTIAVSHRIDAAAISIIAPAGNIDSGAVVTPMATVSNNGTSAASVPVRMTIGPGYSDIQTVSVAPGETTTVTFSDWTATPVGLLAVRCSTALAGDEQPVNDTVSGTVRVTTVIDAATIALLAPTDTVDSYTVITPQARVANLGQNQAQVPVLMRIGSSYISVDTIAILPGETMLVSFPSWTASPLGTHAVRCSTMLAGDTTAGNDYKDGSVTVIAHRDARAVAILAPFGAYDSGTVVTPVCRIANDGTSPSAIPVRLTIGSGYDETRTKTLAPGATDTIHFAEWVASPLGNITARCSTALAGDEQPEDDTVSTTVYVGVRIDAEAEAILAPTGTVDSGTTITPVCSIANNSASARSIPVWLSIGSGYLQTRTKLVSAGASDTLHFPTWTASPLGTHTVKCSTALAGDTIPANDTTSTTVTVVAHIDAELTTILAPTGTVDSGTVVTPSAVVTNNGTHTEMVPVCLTIGAGYSEFDTITLTPGQVDTLQLRQWTAQPVGTLGVQANTYLAGDEQPVNDTVSGSVEVLRLPVLDVGVTTILAPTGFVDTGDAIIPRAVIANFGTLDTTFPVTMNVGSGYSQTLSLTLPAGMTDTMDFPVWNAGPCTTLSVVCYSSLVGDSQRHNDTAYASVTVNTYVDAASTRIIVPTGYLDSGANVIPLVSATNLSTRAQSVPIRLTIGSGYDDTTELMLAPGQTDTFLFRTWTASPVGNIAVRCSTGLAGDQQPGNDTLSGQVSVGHRVDAATIAIVAPVDTVDTGSVITPKARVANLGTADALIPVRFIIGTGYADSTTASLAPGETALVSFADWTATPPGTHAVRCTTMLAADTFNTNDARFDSVTVITHLDASAIAIIVPAGILDSGTAVTPICRIAYAGSNPASIPVRMRIGATYDQTATKLLSPGMDDTLRFPTWVALPLGFATIRCSTGLAGDEQPANDTVSGTVQVRVGMDGAALAIVTPSGTLDSGTVTTPVCSIANYGTRTQLVTARLHIGTNYIQTRSRMLAPGRADTFIFRNWTASPVGTIALTCTTIVAGDQHPENNRATSTVIVVRHIDAAAVELLAPVGAVDSGTAIVPACRIANYSTSSKLIPVRLRIGAGYSDSSTRTIAAGSVDTVRFATWVASPVGTHSVRCSTALAGDENPANDTLSGTVEVGVHVNAAALAIIAPAGTVDSGSVVTPVCRIANYSTSSKLVPVNLRIGTSYTDARAKLLAPAQSDTVQFQDWVAQPVGTQAVVCSTALAGDEIPNDDRITDSVRVAELVDAAAVRIVAPTGSLDSGAVVTPQAVVANLGSAPADVPLEFRIGSVYADFDTVSLAAGESLTVSFSPWQAEPVGSHSVLCAATLAGDSDPANDTARAQVTVAHRRDAACLAIIAPTGSSDSGTVIAPAAVVANLGTLTALIPVMMWIGADYAQSNEVILAPGQSDTMRFPDWVASPLGWQTVRCSTALSGDAFTANDQSIDSALVGALRDAAVTAILAPTGTVDSGSAIAPMSVVANLGTSPAWVPVRMSVGTGYLESTSIFLASGESDTARFPDWTAAEPGWNPVVCSTALPGDTNPANDRMFDSVFVRVQNDAAAILILAPAGIIDSGTIITPVCSIANNSTGPRLIPVVLNIGDGYCDTTEKSMPPGARDTVRFAPWQANTLGSLTVRCSTALAGDQLPENDTISDSITVVAHVDAGVTAILAPLGRIDSGTTVTPVARIINNSTSPKLVPVTLTIGGFYSDAVAEVLAPGEEDTVLFAPWLAEQVGIHTVRCSTALAGDEDPANDTLSATVEVSTFVDVGAVAILAPLGSYDSGAVVTPQATVRNFGAGARLVPVHMMIGPAYDESTTVTVLPDSTLTVTFPDWTATPVGTFAVVCSTALAGDENPANDTVRTLVTVGHRSDAACLAIVAPTGSCDSGTVIAPTAVVANLGTLTALIPVMMWIGTDYDQSNEVILAPGQSDTMRFPDWVASPLGWQTVRCSTALSGDTFTANDQRIDSVLVGALRDAAVTAILAPTGAVDSGSVVTPMAIAANLGTSPAWVPVRLAIGTAYVESTSVLLASGESDTARFPDWIAYPLGWQVVRCSTALAGDTNNANDQLADSVLVTVQVDAAARAIVAPLDIVDSGSVITPVARIANYSTGPKLIPVRLTISPDYADSTVEYVLPGTEVAVAFAPWTATTLGSQTVRCSTGLQGDEQPENDTVSNSVLVVARVDAGVTAILAPFGTIDSGAVVTPVARIINNSISFKQVPVVLNIGDFYSDTAVKLLAPAQTDTVEFAPWVAEQLGTHAVRCSTALPGDEYPFNDTLSTVVNVRVSLDAAVTQILAPTGLVDSGSVTTPQAVITNNSVRKVPIPIHFFVATGYHESTTVAIAAGASRTIPFPDWPANTVGTWAVWCSTALAGDIEPANDVQRDSVVVLTRHDVGCYVVLAPTGTVDSGAAFVPQAMVTNYGIGPEAFAVRMMIDPSYFDERLVNLNPGESTLVMFTDWTAYPVGVLSVRCSTCLASDTTTANDMATDSVTVTSRPDAAVTDLYAPAGRVDSGTVITPYARICNYGLTPIMVPVRMRIGTAYNEARTKYLGIGAKDSVLFPDWVASPLGTSTVVCSTELAGDLRPENDCKRDSVLVGAWRDAALLTIIVPSGRLDSGTLVTPTAVVANFGTSGALVPVRMRIADNYDSTASVFVPAGDSAQVSFPGWTAFPVGTQGVRCSTMLAEDYTNDNDLLTGTVVVGVTKDAACVELQSPRGTVDSGQTVTPQAVIANYSTSPSLIPLFMRIGTNYFKVRRKFLEPGQSDTVTFPDWTASSHGSVAVTCSTCLTGDVRNKNDAIHSDVNVQHDLDASVIEIIVPTGTVDSGRNVTPKARIANYGAGTVPVPVELRIGDFYRSVRTKVLAAGANDTVHFEIWTATQVGHHAVRCSTMLDADLNPANDRKDAWTDVLWRDAGCIRILAPLGIVPADSSISPRAVVRNFGTVTERIPTVFRTSTGYAELQYAESLAPGDSVELVFPPTTLGPGDRVVSCSTAMHTDMHLANDKLTTTVFGAARLLILESDSACTASPGAAVSYLLKCTNNGNASDTVDVSTALSRPGWETVLLDSTGTVALTDHNGNGIPDLGSLAPAASAWFVCRVTVPMDALGRSTDSTRVQVASGTEPRITARVSVQTSVQAIANLMVEPDQLGVTPPGTPRCFTLTITNLGNVEDYADLTRNSTRGIWKHQLLDPTGKALGDRNNNGHLDVGPVAPLGGTAEFTLMVMPDSQARLDQTDTTLVRIRSFEDDQVEDEVTIVTQVTGSVNSLVVEPDQSGALAVGDSGTYACWVKTAGTIQQVVNLSIACSQPAWQVSLRDETGTRGLTDTDFDGQLDVGAVVPAARKNFTLRVVAPDCGKLAGNIDSLFTANIRIAATLSGNPAICDSALLFVTAVPRFEVHNFSNPFSERTRFVLSVPSAGRVNLVVYNRLGEVIKRIVDNRRCPTGIYAVDWDATNSGGRKLAPGIYLYMLELLPDRGLPQRSIKKAIIKR